MEKCEFCTYVGRADNVRAHKASVHDKIRPICDGCSKDFATKSSLNRHRPKCKGTNIDEVEVEVPVEVSVEEAKAIPIEDGANQPGTLFTVADVAAVHHVITLRNGMSYTIPGDVATAISFIFGNRLETAAQLETPPQSPE